MSTNTHNSNVLPNQSRQNFKAYSGVAFNKPLAIIALLVTSPILMINSVLALINRESVLTQVIKIDALGRSCQIREFRFGYCKKLARLLDIITGNISFCGVPLTHTLTISQQKDILSSYNVPAGIISAYDVHRLVGLVEKNKFRLLTQQLESSHLGYLALLIKGLFCYAFYNQSDIYSRCPSIVNLFGIGINNTTMKNAVEWVVDGKKFKGIETKDTKPGVPRTGFFINANSINVCAKTPHLAKLLKQADCLFPDGSGLRIAARYKQLMLKDNINGTDMLPVLCAHAAKNNKSLFLLGAKPETAQKAAQHLLKNNPDLKIVGCHHGYFSPSQNQDVINLINQSQADIVLVAQGTPIQEEWICQNRAALKCQAILGVGGLFDYFSGNIPRAPMWMRELGLEWVWRLMQEPVAKFERYVIGTPEFLYRTFILKQVNKGV